MCIRDRLIPCCFASAATLTNSFRYFGSFVPFTFFGLACFRFIASSFFCSGLKALYLAFPLSQHCLRLLSSPQALLQHFFRLPTISNSFPQTEHTAQPLFISAILNHLPSSLLSRSSMSYCLRSKLLLFFVGFLNFSAYLPSRTFSKLSGLINQSKFSENLVSVFP